MTERMLILLLLLAWYLIVRQWILTYVVPVLDGGHNPSPEYQRFAWWWSWLMAIPVTFLSVVLSAFVIGFIVYG